MHTTMMSHRMSDPVLSPASTVESDWEEHRTGVIEETSHEDSSQENQIVEGYGRK